MACNISRIALSACLCFAALVPQVGADPSVAISGYDPVAYFTEGRPVIGDPALFVDWDGTRYRFANSKHKESFAAQPARFAPQFSGHCTGGLCKGKTRPADPKHWAISDVKKLLFSSKQAYDHYLANKKSVQSQAEQHWPNRYKSKSTPN
jgi:YHS domain-containing protein